MPNFDLLGARNSGATDEQILSFIKTKVPNFDVDKAIAFQSEQGDTDAINSVVSFLNTKGLFDTATTPKKQSYEPYVNTFNQAAKEFGVDAFQTLAMAKQESGFNPRAKSPVGARGLMQIMPNTAKEIAAELGIASYDLNDPRTNIRFGTYYYKKMLDMFNGDPEKAWAAYNGGAKDVKTAVARAGDNWKEEIKRMKPKHAVENIGYVDSVGKHLKDFEQLFKTTQPKPVIKEPEKPVKELSVLDAAKGAVIEEEAIAPATERFVQPEDVGVPEVEDKLTAFDKAAIRVIEGVKNPINLLTGSIGREVRETGEREVELEDIVADVAVQAGLDKMTSEKLEELSNNPDDLAILLDQTEDYSSTNLRDAQIFIDRKLVRDNEDLQRRVASERKIAFGKSIEDDTNKEVAASLDKLADIYIDDAEKAREGMFTFIKKAWTKGDLNDAISQGLGMAAAVGNQEVFDKLMSVKQQVLGTDKKPGILSESEKQTFTEQIVDSMIGMLPFMGKRIAQSIIPGAGPSISGFSSWAQGTGDVASSLVEAGANMEDVRELSGFAGILYSAIEKAQLDEVMGLTNATGLVKGRVLQNLITIAKQRGISVLKEAGEEGLQALVTNTAIEVGKEQGRLDDATALERVGRVITESGKEAFMALFSMGLLEGGKSTLSGDVYRAVTGSEKQEEVIDAERVKEIAEEPVQEKRVVEEEVQPVRVRDDEQITEERVAEEEVDELKSDVATMSAEEIAKSNDLDTIELLKDEISAEKYNQAVELIKEQEEEVVKEGEAIDEQQVEAEDVKEEIPQTVEKAEQLEKESKTIVDQEVDIRDYEQQEAVQEDAAKLIDEKIIEEPVSPEEIFIRESRVFNQIESVKDKMEPDAYEIVNRSIKDLAAAARDGATGLQTRHQMVSGIVDAMKAVKDNKLDDFSVVLTDMANLGGANTRFGHEGANEVLKAISNNLKTGIESRATEDMFTEVYRPGGDEFAAAFVGASEEEIIEIMNQVQADNDNYVKTAKFENPATGEMLPLADMPHEKKAGLPVDIGGVSYGVVSFKDFSDRQGEEFNNLSEHDQVAKFLSYADQLQALQANERVIRKVAETPGFDARVNEDNTIKVFKIDADIEREQEEKVVEDAKREEDKQEQEEARQLKQDARAVEQRVSRDQAEVTRATKQLEDTTSKEIAELKDQIAELQEIVKNSTKDITDAVTRSIKEEAVQVEDLEVVDEPEVLEEEIAVEDIRRTPTPRNPITVEEEKQIKPPSSTTVANETSMTGRQVADLEEFAESGNMTIDERGLDYYAFTDENGVHFQVYSDEISDATSIYEDAIKEHNKNVKYMNTKDVLDRVQAELSNEVMPEYKSAGDDLGVILSNIDRILSAEKGIRKAEGKAIPYRPQTFIDMDSLDTFINDFKKERRSESVDYKRLRRIAFDDGQYEALWNISKKFGKRGWPVLTEEEASALSNAELLPSAASRKVSVIDTVEAGGVTFDPANKDMVRYLKNGQMAINAEGELELTAVNPELYRTDEGNRIIIEQQPDKTVKYLVFDPDSVEMREVDYESLIFMNSVPPNKASKPSGAEIREFEVSGRKKTRFVSDEISLDATTVGANSFDDFDMELQPDAGQSFVEDSRFDEEDEDLSDVEIADSYDMDEYYGTDGAFYNRSKVKESSNGKYRVRNTADVDFDVILPATEIAKEPNKFSEFLYTVEELIDTGVLDWDTDGIETAEQLSEDVLNILSAENESGLSLINTRNIISSIHNAKIGDFIDKKHYLDSMKAVTEFEDVINNLAPKREDNKRRVLSSIEAARRGGNITNDNAAWLYSIMAGVDSASFDINFMEKKDFVNDGTMGYFMSANDSIAVNEAITETFTHELAHFMFYRGLTGKERFNFYKNMADRYWAKGKYNRKQMKADLINAGALGKSEFKIGGETFKPSSDYDYLVGNFSEFFAELVSRRIHELSGLVTRDGDLTLEEARILSDVDSSTMSLIDKVIEWIKDIYRNLTGQLSVNKYAEKYLDKLYNIERAANVSYDMINMTDEEISDAAKTVRPFYDNGWNGKSQMTAKTYKHANKIKKIKAPSSKSKPLIKMARAMRNKDIVKKSLSVDDIKKAIVAYTYDAINSDAQRKTFLKNAVNIKSRFDKYHLRAIEMMERRDETAIKNKLLSDVRGLIKNGLKSTAGDNYNKIARDYYAKYNLSRLVGKKADKFKEEINRKQEELEALESVKWFDKLSEQQALRVKRLENENLADLTIDQLEEMFTTLSEEALADMATAKEARDKSKNDMQLRKESAEEITNVLKNFSKRFETFTALINDEVFKKGNAIQKSFQVAKQFSGKTMTMYSSSVSNLETILDMMDDEYKRAVLKYNETHPDKPKTFARHSLSDMIAKEVIDADRAAIEFEDGTMSYFITEFNKLGIDAEDLTVTANTSVYDLIRSLGDTKKLSGAKTFKLGDRDVRLTGAERISLFLTANDPDGLSHILNGGFFLGKDQQTRFTPTITELDKITDLNDKELKVARVIESYFNGYQKTRLNDWSNDYLGYSIANNENYFPLSVKGTEVKKADKYIIEDKKSGQVGIATPGALLARRGDKSQGVVIRDAFEVIAQSSDDIGRYTSYAGRLAKAKTVLNSIQKSLVESGRHTQFKNVNEMLERIATKDRWAGSGAMARLLYQKLPAVYARGVLGFKAAVAMLQTISGTNYFQMPWSNIKDLRAIKDFNSNNVLKEMAAHSPLSKYRILGNIERDVNQTGTAASARYIATAGKRRLRRFLNPEVGMSPITMMDMFTITALWSANKRSVEREGELEVNSQEYWDEIVRRHEMTIRHTQPEFNLSSRGTLTSNPYLKPFTMFSSQLSKNFMMNVRAINDIKNGNIKRGYSKLFLLNVIQPLMIMTIRRVWESIMEEGVTPEAWDDLINKIMKDLQSGKFAGDWAMVVSGQLVGLGPFIQTAFGTFGSEFGGAAEEIYTSLVRGVKHLVNIAKGDEEPDARTLRKSGVGLGIPMDGVYQINKAVTKTLEGMVE